MSPGDLSGSTEASSLAASSGFWPAAIRALELTNSDGFGSIVANSAPLRSTMSARAGGGGVAGGSRPTCDSALPPLSSATSARRKTTTRKTTANNAAVATSRVRQVSSTWLARSSATTGAQGGGGLKWRGRQGFSSRRWGVVISGSRQCRRSAGRASAAYWRGFRLLLPSELPAWRVLVAA